MCLKHEKNIYGRYYIKMDSQKMKAEMTIEVLAVQQT